MSILSHLGHSRTSHPTAEHHADHAGRAYPATQPGKPRYRRANRGDARYLRAARTEDMTRSIPYGR